MISIKKEQEIEKMRVAGKIAYDLLMSLKDIIKPGITTKEIDKYAYDFITSRDATPAFLDYEGYPASVCVSINEEVVHGIPKADRMIKNGDIVSLDIGLIHNGWQSDAARTHAVGNVSKEALELIRTGKVDVRKILTKVISLQEAPATVEDIERNPGSYMKVVVRAGETE